MGTFDHLEWTYDYYYHRCTSLSLKDMISTRRLICIYNGEKNTVYEQRLPQVKLNLKMAVLWEEISGNVSSLGKLPLLKFPYSVLYLDEFRSEC